MSEGPDTDTAAQPGRFVGRFLPNAPDGPDTQPDRATAGGEGRADAASPDLLPGPDAVAFDCVGTEDDSAARATGVGPLHRTPEDLPAPAAVGTTPLLDAAANAESPGGDSVRQGLRSAAPGTAASGLVRADAAAAPLGSVVEEDARTVTDVSVQPLVATLADITAGRDVNVARNLSVTNYMHGLAQLLPHLVSRDTLVPSARFEPPPGYDTARTHLSRDQHGQRRFHVLALAAEPDCGARSAALTLLGDVLTGQENICELSPDWDTPKVAQLPAARETGYLLNLTGTVDALPADFHEQLAGYAARARATDTILVVLAPRSVWSAHAQPASALIADTALGRPDPDRIAARALAATPERAAWLKASGSVFAGQLTPGSSPDDAVRLAAVVAKATGPADADALDQYRGWQDKLEKWFGGDDPDAPPQRALQISAVFLDRAPAQVVLDAADALLALPALRWQATPGGPLAGPSAKSRCQGAGLAFNGDGTASLAQKHPGIDRALIAHLWHTRPQLVAPLTVWLNQISTKDGVAAAHREQIAAALTTVAEAEGPSAVLGLLESWLAEDTRIELAVSLLDDLAVHHVIGPAVRARLRGWASGTTSPQRQQAVAHICARKFGHQYPRTALTRLGYILDARTQPGSLAVARQTLAVLLLDLELAAPTLTSLVGWIPDPGSPLTGGATTLVRLLTIPGHGDPKDTGDHDEVLARVHTLLAHPDPVGTAVRTLLAQGLRRSWRHSDIRPVAAAALDSWCTAAEQGELDPATLNEFVTVVLAEEANAFGDDLDRIIGGTGHIRTHLRRQYFQALVERNRAAVPSTLE